MLAVCFSLRGDHSDFPDITMLAYEAKMSIISHAASAERNIRDCDHPLFRRRRYFSLRKISLKNQFLRSLSFSARGALPI